MAADTKFTAFINRETEHARDALACLDGLETITVPVWAQRRHEWVRGEQALLPRLAAATGVDVLHSLANTGPAWGPFKRVVTIHDIHFRVVPEAHTKLMRLGMSMLVSLAARRSDMIITDAHSTREELHAHLGIERAKIRVVPLGLGSRTRPTPTDEASLRARLGLGMRPIVLCVAAKRPHKNLSRLIAALALITDERRPALVIPGYSTPHEQELRAQASALGVLQNVHLLSWVPAEDLEGLYGAAACLVCPSLHEGFGLPVLEAMARGVPVTCSRRGALVEVAGEDALLFDPISAESIAASIEKLLSDHDLARRLAAAGPGRAAKFNWRATAQATLEAYAGTLVSAGIETARNFA